jgi:hypothetical protein
MRRSYIDPEFKYSNVNGTYNMVEESSFFGSKMLFIENSINISNQSIIFYQTLNGEQLDISVESSLPSVIFNSSDDKFSNQVLSIDTSQTTYQKNTNTKWILNIDLKDALANYIYATLKQYRTFEGVTNVMTGSNNVNFAMKQYITNNVLTKYKYSNIILYVKYKDINKDVLRYQNTWNPNINQAGNILSRIQTQTAADGTSIKVLFTQEEPSNQFAFDYFFDLIFDRI